MAQEKRENLLYPSRGLSETYGFSYQEELTSRDERNMRSIDPITGRARGAQRAGLGLYSGNTELNGTAKKIQAMASVSTAKSQLTWAPSVANLQNRCLPNESDWTLSNGVMDMAVDVYGSIYVLNDFGFVHKYNQSLGLIDTIALGPDLKTGAGRGRVCCIAVDEYQNFFVGEGNNFNGATDDSKGCVHAYELKADDTYARSWTLDVGLYVNDVAVHKGDLILAVSQKSVAVSGTSYWGLRVYADYDVTGLDVPEENTAAAWSNAAFATNVKDTSRIQRIAVAEDGTIYMSASILWLDGAVYKQYRAYLYKLEPYVAWNYTAAAPTWTLYNNGASSSHVSGFGLGVAIGPDTDDGLHTIYTTGNRMASSTRANIRRILDRIDSGKPTVDDSTADTWRVNFGNSSRGWQIGAWHIFAQRLAVDEEGTLYVPYGIRDDANSSFSGSVDASVIAVNKSGATSVTDSGLGAITDPTCLPDAGPVGGVDDNEGGCRVVTVFGDRPTYGTLPGGGLFLDPEDFVDPGSRWDMGDYVTGIDDTDIAPDGTLTADSITLAAGQVGGLITDVTITPTSDAPYTFSLHVKKQSTDNVRILVYLLDVSSGSTVVREQVNNTMDLESGSLSEFYSATTGGPGYSVNACTVESAGDYWRIGYTLLDYDGSSDRCRMRIWPNPQGSGEPARTITVWGAQLVNALGPAPPYASTRTASVLEVTDTVIYGGLQTAAGSAPFPNGPSLWKTQMVGTTQDASRPRTITVLAAANGLFKKVTPSGFVALNTTAPLTATYDSTAPYVQMVAAFSKIYITDGRSYHVYDPETNERTNWVSEDLGIIPPRCRIIETWRGRLVLGRDPEDPSAWHMSTSFDPLSWDNFPQNPSARDAISAKNSRAGGIPDIVNAIIPYNDDLCIIGGDSSIWRMTGDPRAGGQLDLVTDQSGISFGRPWCKDPGGRVWFFGSHGALYVLSRDGLENVSKGKVARSLQDIDLGANYVNLVWNHIDEGVHIFVCPFGAGGTVMLDHWFYDATNGAFHKDRFGILAADKIQPTATIDLNGDGYADRAVLVGCEDGRTRRWGTDNSGSSPLDDEQTSSVNIAIDSYFTAGPLFPPSMTGAAQITEFSALLGEAQDGCNFELFSSDNAEVLGAAKATGTLHAGRNMRKTVRVSGNSLFLRMRNASAGQRWAFELASANVAGAGIKRSGA